MLLVAVLAPALALGLRPSPGCGSPPGYTPGKTTLHQFFTNDTAGLPPVTRSYLVRTPAFANPRSAMPLMFLFHGQGGAAPAMGGYAADFPNFLAVMPQVRRCR
jgi:hypothetical protein